MLIDPKRLSYAGYDGVLKRYKVKEEIGESSYMIHLFRTQPDADEFVQTGIKVGP